jgi:hypothetical protein
MLPWSSVGFSTLQRLGGGALGWATDCRDKLHPPSPPFAPLGEPCEIERQRPRLGGEVVSWSTWKPPTDAALGLLGVPALASSPNLPGGAIDQTAAVQVLVGPAYHRHAHPFTPPAAIHG